MNKRIIGLTGGIATGKTTVANYLEKTYNLPVLDADIYAREAVATGSPIFQQIVGRYGTEILLDDGNLNRQKLGEIIFNDPTERLWLENLIHPYVQQRFIRGIKESNSETLVLVVPLLFEAEMTDMVTEIWVVYCNEEQQLPRLMQRNNLTLEQAKARISSQISLEEKVKNANVVLDNSSTVEVLLKQINTVLAKYEQESSSNKV
ncbi:dephospho-CoA kinase [Mastigocoleus sp. MO_188.B34]|uniref:dephospho-CoA kinase n=1 Tax=Mastigocoleus sp. MO_188.B34 TaxID=3036635 RepID=UPI0026185BF3|nr:dephospho-CoA kinase [Mastigocoleus sp. MO_188.B34]MDJ0696740.1 dephospho-CoA kinase [Mastigocoleus sp. MO_188.B34]